MNIGELIPHMISRLPGDSPELDAQVLLAHVLGHVRTWLLAHPELELSAPQLDVVEAAISRLEAGEPLPYVLGHWEFYGLDFNVTPDVLIPRPETELLVERAIAWLKASPERARVIDVGTGSGAIGVTIATHIPDARILATDISPAALAVAKHNAEKFHVHHQIEFMQCDLLPESKVEGQKSDLRLSTFNLICANLPYIPTETLRRLAVFETEPSLALDGGADGLDLIRRLLAIAPDWLAPGGRIMLEIEASQGMQVLSLAYDLFSEAEIHLHQDLAGHDRLLEITLPTLIEM
ncbi:MAG: peptide chain release factor N(5)-glutamine methyltransferase [Chloroflexi bacterium]|nr:peptide chain release factor N(5)-glutamine methyltransferase [Chloroflexota bacterium]